MMTHKDPEERHAFSGPIEMTEWGAYFKTDVKHARKLKSLLSDLCKNEGSRVLKSTIQWGKKKLDGERPWKARSRLLLVQETLTNVIEMW